MTNHTYTLPTYKPLASQSKEVSAGVPVKLYAKELWAGGGEERHHGCRAAHAHVYRGRAESRHWTELQTRASFVDMKIS